MDIYRKYVTYSVDDFLDLHNLAFLDSSKSTKGTFAQSLKRIEKVYGKPLQELNLDFLRGAEAFMKKLEDSEYSPNTILTTYTQVLKVLKMIDAPLNTYSQYVKILKEKTSERDELDKLKVDLSKETLIPYDTMQEKVISKIEEYSEEEDYYQLRNYIILMLFVLQIPVRISNYTKMKITNRLEDTSDKNFNWLFVSNKSDALVMWVFNKYRTAVNLGTKEVVVTDDRLKEFLKFYIDVFDLKGYLFPKDIYTTKIRPMIAKDIQSSIMLSTYKLFEKALSVEQIRASYMIRVAQIDPDFESKMEIASIMGYSNTLKMEMYE